VTERRTRHRSRRRRPDRLVGHVHGAAAARRHMLWSVRRRQRHVGRLLLLLLLLHSVVRRHRVVGTLPCHTVRSGRGTEPWLWERLLVPGVAHVRRVKLGAAMARARSSVWTGYVRWRRRLQGESVAWDERLRFRVEGLAVVAARDGVLALGIARVDMCR
jgi:hypothetical protein